MSKLAKEEIAARRKRMQAEALQSVAKTEQLNLRIDEASVSRLYSLAGKQGKPVGAMVREWIVDRLDSEENSDASSVQKLTELVLALSAKIDRLYARVSVQSKALESLLQGPKRRK